MVINPNLLKTAVEWGPKLLNWFELVEKKVEEFTNGIDMLFPESNLCVVEENVDDTLTKEMLFDIIRKNAVHGANGMAAIYKKSNDDVDVIYLASVKDHELIDEKDNKFIIIKVSDGIKREVKEIFASAMETEYGKLIIIK